VKRVVSNGKKHHSEKKETVKKKQGKSHEKSQAIEKSKI